MLLRLTFRLGDSDLVGLAGAGRNMFVPRQVTSTPLEKLVENTARLEGDQ